MTSFLPAGKNKPHDSSRRDKNIRVTFDNKADTLYTSPLVFTHHKMLKTLFNTDLLLCSARF